MSEMNEHNTRRLEEGEVTREGDEYQSYATGRPWFPIDRPGNKVGQNLVYRRRIVSIVECEAQEGRAKAEEERRRKMSTTNEEMEEERAEALAGGLQFINLMLIRSDKIEKRIDALENAVREVDKYLEHCEPKQDALEGKGEAEKEENEDCCYYCKHFSGSEKDPCPLWPCGNKWEPKQDAL